MLTMRVVILVVISLTALGCCDQCASREERNACLKLWYGLEPDPKNPEVYKHGLELWEDESFGPDSGWHKTWVRLFGTKEEKQNLKEQIQIRRP